MQKLYTRLYYMHVITQKTNMIRNTGYDLNPMDTPTPVFGETCDE